MCASLVPVYLKKKKTDGENLKIKLQNFSYKNAKICQVHKIKLENNFFF